MTKRLLSYADLERMRIKAGLSRAEVSRRAGISESTFSLGLRKGRIPKNTTRTAVLKVLDEWGINA